MAFTSIFSGSLGQAVLVFVLIFTLIFAILQKSKILGDGKKQIDALVALSIALLVISVGYAMNLITSMAPFLSVSLVIILVFLLLVGIFSEKELKLSNGVRTFFGILAFVAVVIAVLYITNSFPSILNFFSGSSDSGILGNVVLLIIIALAIWMVLRKESSSKD